ncbi:hypothetical protein B484DRAFT_444875 [Ochromonadaceae sp. CCMP2298]|nr:hypothetical protein B484DRAFT_444875 [Ochromonadaceae sp. CCMP2298]
MALFLGLVTSAIKAEPSADSLYKLLRLADPDLSPAGIRTKAAREKLYKKLLAEVNPGLPAYQELSTFYEQCSTCNFAAVAVKREITPAKEENPSKRSRPLLPYKFSVEEQWPAVMKVMKIYKHHEHMKEAKKWCFNVRGHIVHHTLTGRLATCVYPTDTYHQLPAGNDVESIKEELMHHGPVVSTSFNPSGAVTKEYGLETPSAVVIMGWRQVKDKGEVWLVCAIPKDEVIEIPFGSCSLTDDVQIQVADLGTYRWQYYVNYPYLERDFSGETDWMNLSEYDATLSAAELNGLTKKLGEDKDLDIFEMLSSKRKIEICPKGLMAQSRRAEIMGLVAKVDGSWTLRTKFE